MTETIPAEYADTVASVELYARGVRSSFTVTFTDGVTVHAVARHISDSAREWNKTTRVYGALDALVPDLLAAEPYQGEALLTADESAPTMVKKATWTAWRNAMLKAARPLLMERLVAVRELVGDTALTANLDPRDDKLAFSVKAGCSCPCSPGFVLAWRWGAFDLHFEAPKTDTN